MTKRRRRGQNASTSRLIAFGYLADRVSFQEFTLPSFALSLRIFYSSVCSKIGSLLLMMVPLVCLLFPYLPCFFQSFSHFLWFAKEKKNHRMLDQSRDLGD